MCLVVGRCGFDERDGGGFWRLLTRWGGEALYWAHENTPVEDRLRALGRPAIVVARLRFELGNDHHIRPSLAQAFVGAALGLPEAGCAVFHRAPIPGDQIEALWHPGDPAYDRHVHLPRA